MTRLWRGRPVLVVALVLTMASAAEALILLPTPIQSRLAGPVAWIGGGLGAFLILLADPLKAVWFVVFLLILQQVEGNLIYPKVVGKSVGLPGGLHRARHHGSRQTAGSCRRAGSTLVGRVAKGIG